MAISKVLDSFGGICKYSIGFSSKAKYTVSKDFILSLDSSSIVMENPEYLNYYASAIAHIFYKNLPNFQKEYNSVIVQLKANAIERVFDFSTVELQMMSNQLEIYNQIVELLRNKDWVEIGNRVNFSSTLSINKIEFLEKLKQQESKFSKINNFLILGFDKYVIKDNSNFIKVGGILFREREQTEFSIIIEQNSVQKRIVLCDYKN